MSDLGQPDSLDDDAYEKPSKVPSEPSVGLKVSGESEDSSREQSYLHDGGPLRGIVEGNGELEGQRTPDPRSASSMGVREPRSRKNIQNVDSELSELVLGSLVFDSELSDRDYELDSEPLAFDILQSAGISENKSSYYYREQEDSFDLSDMRR